MMLLKNKFEVATLVCLSLGGIGLLTALFFALHSAWLKSALFSVAGLATWYMSVAFARLAIAASGRQ